MVPEFVARCAARWSLQIGQPLEGGYIARVFSCVHVQGNQLVLKLSPPEATAH
jgi:hypothetical protein